MHRNQAFLSKLRTSRREDFWFIVAIGTDDEVEILTAH